MTVPYSYIIVDCVCEMSVVSFVVSLVAGNLVLDIFRAPIQIIAGLLYGTIFGLTLWVLPTKHFVSVITIISLSALIILLLAH